MRILFMLFIVSLVSLLACEDTVTTEEETGTEPTEAIADVVEETVDEADVVPTLDVGEEQAEETTDEEISRELEEPEPNEGEGDPTGFENTNFEVEFVPTIPAIPSDDD